MKIYGTSIGHKFLRMRRIGAPVPLCIILLLSGCGGGGSPAPSSTSNGGNPCENGSASYTPISAPITATAAAARISFAIKNDGTLWAWGTSANGQLGAGAATSSVNPIKIGDGFTAVSASFGHSLGLKSNGTLWAWGDNSFGQLGNNSTTASNVPIQIGDSANTYTAISAGLNFSLAVKSDGTLWAWGDNHFGQLGIGDNNIKTSPAPIQVGSGNGYTAISAGTSHALALKTDHSMWAWGDNSFGQLGDDTTNSSNVPVRIDAGESYGAIAAGYYYSLAVRLDGSLMAWGNNIQGKPANPIVTDHVPTKIGDAFSPDMDALSASKFSILGSRTVYFHSLALKNDGSLWAWGDNIFGQLGNNNPPTPSPVPEQILADSGYAFTAVSAGDDDHSLAIKNDGSLWAWGSNSCGQLGDGTTSAHYEPRKVSR